MPSIDVPLLIKLRDMICYRLQWLGVLVLCVCVAIGGLIRNIHFILV
jgi:hypothetical protein